MPIHWSGRARRHLIALREFIAADDPIAANQLAGRIVHAVGLIADHPHIGRVGRIADTREFAVSGTPYLIAYTVLRNGTVEILAVLHGARRWPETM